MVTGAEFKQGPKTPGGFYYYYLFLSGLFAPDIATGAAILLPVSYIIALIALFVALRKYFQAEISIFVVGSIASLSLVNPTFTQLWNPSYLFAFTSLGFSFALLFYYTKNWNYIFLLNVFLALGMQIHFSAIYSLVAFNSGVLLVTRYQFKHICLNLLLPILLTYSPYIYGITFGSEDLGSQISSGILYEDFKHFNSGDDAKISDFWNYLGIALGFDYHFYNLNTFYIVDLSSFKAFVRDILKGILPAIVMVFQLYCLLKIAKSIIQRITGISRVVIIPFVEKLNVFLFFSIVVAAVTHMNSVGPFEQRRLVWAVPIIAFMLASSLSYFVKMEFAPRSMIRKFVLLIIGFSLPISIATYVSYRTYFNYNNWVPNVLTMKEIEDVISVSHHELGLSPNEIRTKVLLLNQLPFDPTVSSGSAWYPYSIYSSAEYFISRLVPVVRNNISDSILPKKNGYQNVSKCTFVFPVGISHTLTPNINDISEYLLRANMAVKILSIETVHTTHDSVYMQAKIEGNNCLSNLENVYFPFGDEILLESLTENLDDDDVIIRNEIVNDEVVRKLFLFSIGDKVPVPVMVSIYYSNGNVITSLISRPLRGWDGTKSFEILNPRVEFQSIETGIIKDVQIHQGYLGGPHGGGSDMPVAPWNSDWAKLESGEYIVKFKSDDYREFVKDNWIGSIDRVLNEKLVLTD